MQKYKNILKLVSCYKTFYYFCATMKKLTHYIVFSIGLLMLLASCSDNKVQQQDAEDAYALWMADSASLRVAVTPTLDCLPLFVAQAEGMFERHGVSVSLYPFNAHMDCDTAFQSGWVDAMTTDLVRAEYLKSKGTSLRYLTATDLHWQLLADQKSKVKHLNQLEHKMIAMTRYSATALLADDLVDTTKMTNDYVFRLQINDVNVRFQMLQTHEMDLMFLPEPYAAAARNLKSELLYDTQWNDVCMGALVVREAVMGDTLYQRQTEGLLKAYDEACDTINSRGIAYFGALLKDKSGVTFDARDSLLTTIHFNASHQPREIDLDKARQWLQKQ